MGIDRSITNNSNIRIIILFLALCYLQPTFAYDAFNRQNVRYCEIVVGHGFSAKIYTSFNLHDCPDSLWKKVNVSQIKKSHKATFVYLNGPRYALMDNIINSSIDSKIVDFNGIKMREIARLKVRLSDILHGFVPYITHDIEKTSTLVYEPGSRVYELIDPKNQVYVMQSYSAEVAPLTTDKLVTLGDRLKLPHGWKFKTGVLSERHDLMASNHHAVVLQDSYKNTYHLAKGDFLKAK